MVMLDRALPRRAIASLASAWGIPWRGQAVELRSTGQPKAACPYIKPGQP